MEARRAHHGEPPFFTGNLGDRMVFVQQQPLHVWITLMAALQIAMVCKLPYTVFRDAILAHPTTKP